MEATTQEQKKEVVKKIRPAGYVDPVGLNVFGDTFTGFNKIGEIKDLIPAFKDFYYQAKVKDPNATLKSITREFNTEVCAPVQKKFHPYINQLRAWRKKWDLDLMQQMAGKEVILAEDFEKRNIHQVIKTRNDERALVVGMPTDVELEGGLRTLGGEIMNDAIQMLRDDQELEEIYTSDELMKRRNYIVNVFGHVTKLVHGKAALMLKMSEEKRNNASFLMTLLAKASAGKITDDEIEILEASHKPTQDVVKA
jgi:hypothetical protein